MALALQQGNNNPSLLDNISKLSDLFLPKTSNVSGGTTTQQTVISPEAAQALINTILGGSQGLSSVASGQKTAGLYDSSTNQLLVNDLISRTAGEIAARGAPTRINTPNRLTTVGAPLSPVTSLLATGAAYLGNKVLKSTGITDKVDKGVDAVVNSIFGATSATGVNAGQGLTAGTLPTGTVNIGALTSDNPGFNAGSYTLGASIESNAINSAGSSTGANAAESSSVATVGSNIDKYDELADATDAGFSASSSAADSSAAVDAGAAGSSGLPVAGIAYNVASGNYSGAAGSALGSVVGGAFFGPPGAAVGGAIGGALGSECFITTAVLTALGIDDDKCTELQTLRKFRDNWLRKYHMEDIVQYYNEAPALADKLLENPYCLELSVFLYTFFILPAIAHIEKEQYDQAYSIYKYMFNNVKSYLTADPGYYYIVQDYVTTNSNTL